MRSINISLLNVIGREYVVDHCIAFFNEERERRKYLDYYANALSVMTETLATYYGGKYIRRMSELDKPADSRTASDIINSIKRKLETP